MVKIPAVLGNTFKIKFSMLRLLENRMVHSKIKFTTELIVDDDASALQQVTILTNIRKWFDIVVTESIAYSIVKEIPSCTIDHLNNNLMFCPDEPWDHLLLVLLKAKLNAIGEGIVTAGRCYLDSDLNEGFGNWHDGDPLDMLPSAEEWLGDVRYFDQPWWNRSDGGMIDSWVEPGEDPSATPDILIDLTDDGSDYSNVIPAEIISPFKPVIVTNDQIE